MSNTQEMIAFLQRDEVTELMDRELLVHLLDQLGVGVENYRVLALLPLVLVAWADGKIHRAERRKIMEIAQEHGYISTNSAPLLKSWLHEEPTPVYFEQGLHALVELARHHHGIGADLTNKDLQGLVQLSLDVARTAGALWERTEETTNEEEIAWLTIAGLLSIDDGESWDELLEDLSKPSVSQDDDDDDEIEFAEPTEKLPD